MTVYNINLGIGWASSGVEYAQAYRAQVFRAINQRAKFIFTDMFQHENLQHFTANIGFEDDEIIWLYTFFTDQKIAPSTYTLAQLEETFSEKIARVDRNGKLCRYHFENSKMTVVVALREEGGQCLQRVEYLHDKKLVRKDYYAKTKLFSEYYLSQHGKHKLYLRSFFNGDGTCAYEEHCVGEQSMYLFPNKICYSKDELLAYLLEKLSLISQDIILLDRATGIGQAVVQYHGAAKLGIVIHAEHYNAKETTENHILWNNYYEYQFTNADEIDFFITSTDVQKETLAKQFLKYNARSPKIITIPVGSLPRLIQPLAPRKPYSLITASRLASEKHIDWLVLAVIEVRQHLPIQFDIYGEGGQRQLLSKLIEEHQAQDYIHLKGHQELKDVYQQYEMYLTGSTSEGFGLTLLEAVGSGLPIIGLDVPYGNQTFVKNAENGYLIPYQNTADSSELISAFADKIIQFYGQLPYDKASAASYHIAKGYLQEAIENKWKMMIMEVIG